MEEIEVPLEGAHEHMQEASEHGHAPWITHVALSSALLAVLAAAAALLSGHHVNESMLGQIQASDKWAFFQAKSIKSSILESRMQILEAIGKPVPEADHEKVAEYKKEQAEISKEAEEFEADSHKHLRLHAILSRAVTMFQVAIAIGAIAALARRRKFWYVSLAFGALGGYFLIFSFI